ncbi:MAG: hypothetical protein C5B49_00730 [Bdellovibrio sp.]|nr:MAG: hypothetical protein C5B49_00730 [Bdellovibrio sp.]
MIRRLVWMTHYFCGDFPKAAEIIIQKENIKFAELKKPFFYPIEFTDRWRAKADFKFMGVIHVVLNPRHNGRVRIFTNFAEFINNMKIWHCT